MVAGLRLTYRLDCRERPSFDGLSFQWKCLQPNSSSVNDRAVPTKGGYPICCRGGEVSPNHFAGIQAAESTWPEVMKAGGYRTGIFGKWHLGYFEHYNPLLHGFDKFIGCGGNVDFFSHIDQAGNEDWWNGRKLTPETGYSTHLITKHAVSLFMQIQIVPFSLRAA